MNKDEEDRLTIEASKRLVKKYTVSKKKAHEFLVELGTHTTDGKLTKEYGG